MVASGQLRTGVGRHRRVVPVHVQNGGTQSSRGIIVDTMISNTVDGTRLLRGRLEVFREERQGVAAPPSVDIFGFHPWAT